MKKIIITLVSFVAIFSLGFAFMSWKNPRNHPERVSGKAETLINETSGEKKIKIKTAGYYDLIAIKSDDLVAGREFPLVGQTNVGHFFKKNQEVILSPNSEVEMVPSKFEKIEVENEGIKLQNSGAYLIEKQFSVGDYEASLSGVATDTSGVQIIIETLSGKVKQEVSLLNDVDKINLTVSKNTFLRVKKGLNRELRVILKKK
ncbi:MAG: hypothetical protein PHR41_07715 [Lactococcus chungangensis]|uniref:Uncharacterized protein n=1 Tax=Pseudolactococcus chungangensis CAU 28 = DSM 22330 TaxID=1122154 RepID=A0A1K2HGI7_9LACT|nr:hypothetical protein [Lactococcus chungangensis]MDD3016373.1 hypothetical protein [Lactococcus chungangensis]PCS02701.1 hypothetical protein RR45_GL000508 [Lactococcus chungangensis CAU 28 = DSM 22330]SFZ75924.1 hypothetical protein SAMN02746068_01780 [Lactococcus chungangensis CAU 28 = DSM 22330]